MTKEEIERYEYCKDHLKCLKTWGVKLPYERQKYGCGSNTPNIEHDLNEIHQTMVSTISHAMKKAGDEIQEIIEGI